MNYAVNEQQLFSLLDKFFSTMYRSVKFKKEGGYIWVYNGEKIYKTYRKINGVYVVPNVIMSYSPFSNYLEIDPEVYENIIKWIPQFTGKKMIVQFLTEWFKNKFNVDISHTYFSDKDIMDNID